MGGIRRKTIAWLAIVALLGNVLVALAPTKGAAVVDDVLGYLVICTSDGAKTAQDDGGSHGRTSSDHCPACRLLIQFVLAVTFILTAIAFPAVAAAIPIPSGSGLLAIQLSLGGIRSRAPPLAA